MAVCLRLAAGGSVAGVGESALRALSKLDQVMPSRLRSQVSAVHDATVTLTWNSSDSPVEPDVLMTLARACRDREHVSASYVDRAGNATERRLEPYQLVTTGKRWYLLAFDRDREDWRSLRLGPDARRPRTRHHVRRQGRARRRGLRAAVDQRLAVSARRARPLSSPQNSVVAQHFSPSSVTIEADGPDACIVTAGADDPERMVIYFATVGADFEVLEPPEVADAVESAADRLRRAAIRP